MKIVKMNEMHLQFLIENIIEFDEFWNEKILVDEFKNENSKYFVILEDESIIGFGGLWFNIDEAHIMNIAIKKSFRKKGFGTDLLKYLIDIAKEENKTCITLEVRDDNVPAINLYKKMEFDEIGKRKKYYDGKYDAIIMTKYFNKI